MKDKKEPAFWYDSSGWECFKDGIRMAFKGLFATILFNATVRVCCYGTTHFWQNGKEIFKI